jgi:Bacteriophage Lambda NinG protein
MKIEDKAWQVFARFIKLRDSNQYGHCRCIDTGLPIFYKRENGKWVGNMDSGHYITREVKSIMFDERNVHAQYYFTNRMQIMTNYRENLIYKIGEEEVLWLEQQKNNWGKGFDWDIDYDKIIEVYSEKVEILLKNKMF